MRRFFKALLRTREWPKTKKNYQSDVDKFLQDYNAKRTDRSPAREAERAKHAAIARRRDGVVDTPDDGLWEKF